MGYLEYFAITRCLQLRWPQVFGVLTSSEDLCDKVLAWTKDDFRKEATSEDTGHASVAATLVVDRDLKELLYSDQGKLWLVDHSQRRATVEFLRSQRQESKDAAESTSKRYDVFFSYSTKDRKIVTEIAEFLSKEGLRVLMDTQMQFGENFQEVISSAIENSKALAFFVSPNSLESKWAMKETEVVLDKFLKDEKVRLIPVMLPGADWSLLPSFLMHYNALDFRDGLNLDGLARFASALRS